MSYKVKLNVFEGPFDLLVYLIENAEMSIYDIQVSEITKQYIEYIEQMKKMDVTLGAEFMVLAASLIEIKSKMLLPGTKPENSSETLEDPRSELVQKLLEYKRYKAAAAFLEEQEEKNLMIYSKPQDDLSVYTKEPDICFNLDLTQFVKAFNLFLHKKKRIEEIRKHYAVIERQRVSIETRIEQLRALFRKKRKMKFHELLEGELTRYNAILTFISLLEMMRQKTIKVNQTVNFGEITLIAYDLDKQEEIGA